MTSDTEQLKLSVFVHYTIGRLWKLNVVVIVLGLIASSGTHFFEESLQEVETSEVELILVHRDDHDNDVERNERGIEHNSSPKRLRFCRSDQFTFARSEYSKMNGIGTYLLI